jgi:type IV pilus assembly protein PilW|tara:strand:- start:759 stop:1619 length:861 start_codon:yes stop_codon:yes gene_type:complete
MNSIPRGLKFQSGLTLIELMIAGLLSVIIAYFVGNVVISSNSSAANNSGSSEAQESARFISSWLQEEIRRAGYSPVMEGDDIPSFADRCVDPAIVPPAVDADCSYDSTMGDAINDRIAIQWIFDPDTVAARDQLTCTGAAHGLVSQTPVIDVYWIESGNDNNGYDNELRCVTYNGDSGLPIGNAQAIATGIIGLQVLYGESDGPSVTPGSEELKNVSRFVDASAVTDWNNVLSARLSILTRSFTGTPNNPARRSFVLLDAEPYTFDDQIARYPLTITVDLPNKGWR